MVSSSNGPTRAKALLAIAFAGSMFTSQLPALCQKSPETSSSSVIEVIAKNDRATPEEKAYYLLQVASCCVRGGDVAALETTLKARLGQTSDSRQLYGWIRGEHPLISWANSVSLLSHSEGAIGQDDAGKKKISSENRAVADSAIEAAIAQLGHGFNKTETLNMYFIASCLSRMTGNSQNEQKCSKVLNDAIQACEANKAVDSVQVKVVASILNSMAFGLLPIRIPDCQAQSAEQATLPGMKNFDESERLKLRAAVQLDRLPTSDQERRKMHRDLTIWYLKLGKDEQAMKEKQTLFNLVGVKDDRILYPQSGGCGRWVWWTAEKLTVEIDCGMG